MVENRARRWIVTDFIIGACFYEFSVHQYEPVSREYKENKVSLTKEKHLHFCAFRAFCVSLYAHECRYDSQSTQMGADCAEKGHTESTEITENFFWTQITRILRILLNKNKENPDEMVLRTCIMLLIQKVVSKLPPFS